jgi:D-alanyl-D-alanine dipeptidase
VVALAAALALALRSAPPSPAPADLVDATRLVPDAVLDVRYATADNLMGRPLYPEARCLLLRPVAERLARAAASLRAQGFRLRLYDCYRPLAVQRAMWKAYPRKGYVADPAKGSNHNRAAAVDAGLATAEGGPVELPTAYDAFDRRAHAGATEGVSLAARRNRDLLRRAMEGAGFRVNPMEWWHFDAPERKGARVLDVPFSAVAP